MSISAGLGFLTMPFIVVFWLFEAVVFFWVMLDSYLMIVMAENNHKKTREK